MTPAQVVALAVAAVAVLGLVAVFSIAYRRETEGEPPGGLDRRTLRRDRSEVPVMAAARRAEVEEQPAPEVPPEPATPAEPEPAQAVEPVEVRRVEEVSPEEAGVTRRQFFTRALLGTFTAYLALLGLSFLAFLWPRITGGFGAPIDAGDADDLADEVFLDDGSVLPKFVPEARAYVIPFREDEASGTDFDGLPVFATGLTALYQRCVHLGCRVPWCNSSQGFECPCHGSRYNLHGEYEAGPAPRNLDRFRVEVTEGNRFIIHTADIFETPRAEQRTATYPQGPSCITIGGE